MSTKLTRWPARLTFMLAAGLAGGALSAGTARADQFVLFDATFTYTWQNATTSSPSKSHYYVNEGNWLNKARPTNWVSPVNYRNGKVHIRVEVFEKPAGAQKVGWALCYVANQGGYGCPYTDYYSAPGIYEKEVSMTSFYNNQTLQWDRGVKQVDLVYTINDSGSGHVDRYPNLMNQTTPTRLRITMVQVSQGDTYRPAIPGDGGAGDGGGVDAGGGSDAGAADATSGSGGAGGGGADGGGGAGTGSGGGGAGGTGSGAGGMSGGGGGAGPGSGGASGGGSGGRGGNAAGGVGTGGALTGSPSSSSSSGCAMAADVGTRQGGGWCLALALGALIARSARRRRGLGRSSGG